MRETIPFIQFKQRRLRKILRKTLIFSRETFYHTFIGILIYLAQTGQASDIELYNGNLFNFDIIKIFCVVFSVHLSEKTGI